MVGKQKCFPGRWCVNNPKEEEYLQTSIILFSIPNILIAVNYTITTYQQEENNMKKFLFPILSILIVLSFILGGCAPKATPTPTAEPTKAPEKTTSDQRYVMVVLISGHPFWNDIKKGAQDAADQLGVKFEFTGPVEFDAAAQASQVEQLIATKPACIILGSYDPSMTQAINKASDAGIPVITFDSDAPDSKRLTYVGPDHYQIGWEYGKYMAKLLNNKGKVGLLTVLSQTNLMRRVQGVKDYFAQNAPDMQVVAMEDNGGDDQQTADKTKAIIQANPDINGIIVVNATGSGVATALKELNKAGQIKVITSDVSDPILKGITDGAIDATSYVNIYLEGYDSLKLCHDYANGLTKGVPGAAVGVNQLPASVNPGLFFVTKDNASTFMSK
jgi:ribose transport system substrate-binding protein